MTADEIKPFPREFDKRPFADRDLEPALPREVFVAVLELAELVLFFELGEPELFFSEFFFEAELRDDAPVDLEPAFDEELPDEALFAVEPPALRDESFEVVLLRTGLVEELFCDEADFDLAPPDVEPDLDADDFDLDPDEDADFFREFEPVVLELLPEVFFVCAILFPP
ncbi:MAG TPA: hypothetical protein VJV05_12235 [Pyrinomonadaceae bacterium]|nr:hypothetical protein [Pyrinomonadaceae bacterium]